MIPFLKWAGGKRWLVQRALPCPVQYDRLVEPFLGGGAVFFGLEPRKALIADINPELINLYQVVRDSHGRLERILKRHQRLHSPEHYYRTRATSFKNPILMAARTLYLNRTCWNGLYRLNKKGEFNVPIGTKSAVILETDEFSRASDLLSNAEITCQDFEKTIDVAGKGDFLFVDPPYTVKHNMNGFVKYNENIFAWADQLRLRDALDSAFRRGASIVVTNADHASVRELYERDFSFVSLERQCVLAGNGSARGVTSEALFTANL